MAAHCKQIPPQRREPHPPSAYVHGGNELPHVGLGVVSVGGEGEMGCDGWGLGV